MPVLRTILILLGTLSLGIGVLGIVTPGLPATPFFLLTAALYLRSSEKLYRKLVANRLVGKYISEFHHRKGMTLKTKIGSITFMWIMITVSCMFMISALPVIILVVAAGITGTIVMGFVVPTAGDESGEPENE